MAQNDHKKMVSIIRQNLESVKARMKRASENAGRDVETIQLVAVTKLMPLEIIQAGIEAGIRCFGENYAEQAAEKIKVLKTDEEIKWHMIGHIQSRKTETVCEYFDMVHSLDRMKIARYLDRYARNHSKTMPVLIEVNLSGEESKHGWDASDKAKWPDLISQFHQIGELSNIDVQGLMSMPPLFDNPDSTRPIYQKLRELQNFLKQELPDLQWDELSIGTSFDFEVAIEEGATMIRLGTEIFGQRPHA